MELLLIALIVYPLGYTLGTLIYGRPKTDREIDAMIAKMHAEEDARRENEQQEKQNRVI